MLLFKQIYLKHQKFIKNHQKHVPKPKALYSRTNLYSSRVKPILDWELKKMGFVDSVANYFGMPSKKDIEHLQETIDTQNILIKQTDASPSKTMASMMAKETKEATDPQGLIKKRVSIRELQLLYLNNQYIFRAVNIRADELINRGYKIADGDERGRKECQSLIDNSGGDNLFWQLSVNTDIAGGGFLEKVPNQSKSAIKRLKHINPINFGFWTHPEQKDRIVVDDNRLPVAYMQVITDNEGKEQRIKVAKERVAHLKFNTFADEFNGISTIQPVYNTAIRLMNMEQAAAEAAVKTANPTWVVQTKTKSPMELAKWAKILGRISAQEVVFLPEGVEIDLKSPGNENFSAYSDYFMDAVVAASGVPKSILTGSSGSDSGNRSTTQVLSKHLYSLIRSNQKYIEEVFNEIFKDYGAMAGFKPPKLEFDDIAEDADRNGQRATELFGAGLITLEEARDLVGLDTPQKVKDELDKTPTETEGKIDPDKEAKKADMKTFHPAKPGSVEGSQKNNKKEQKRDPDVKSVR